uniref:(northern house mosquito) hypothetical protein n=1 Tax=Culex pipiens TaxID=7175 RepID=A0A8D8CG83_CULPI
MMRLGFSRQCVAPSCTGISKKSKHVAARKRSGPKQIWMPRAYPTCRMNAARVTRDKRTRDVSSRLTLCCASSINAPSLSPGTSSSSYAHPNRQIMSSVCDKTNHLRTQASDATSRSAFNVTLPIRTRNSQHILSGRPR